METSPAPPQQNPQVEKSKWRSFVQDFPIIQFVGAGVIGLCATWTTIQLTQNSQAAELRRQAEKIEKLEKESVSRELFDERTRTIIDELKRQRELQERILQK